MTLVLRSHGDALPTADVERCLLDAGTQIVVELEQSGDGPMPKSFFGSGHVFTRILPQPRGSRSHFSRIVGALGSIVANEGWYHPTHVIIFDSRGLLGTIDITYLATAIPPTAANSTPSTHLTINGEAVSVSPGASNKSLTVGRPEDPWRIDITDSTYATMKSFGQDIREADLLALCLVIADKVEEHIVKEDKLGENMHGTEEWQERGVKMHITSMGIKWITMEKFLDRLSSTWPDEMAFEADFQITSTDGIPHVIALGWIKLRDDPEQRTAYSMTS